MEESEETLSQPYVVLTNTLIFRDGNGDGIQGDAQQEQFLYHLRTGDYFKTIATYVGFLEESLQKHCVEDPTLEDREMEVARQLRKNLVYLSGCYQIVPKSSEPRASEDTGGQQPPALS